MKLDFKLLDKIFITSDTHYNHKNICRGVSEWKVEEHMTGNRLPTRDFDTIQLMNDFMVHSINEMVPEDGVLFHLGDWSFGGELSIPEFRERISCKTIHLITGNHDHHQEKGIYDHLFSSRQKYLELSVGSFTFVLFHFPIASWNHVRKGSFHLHGHQHWKGDLRFGNGRMMDVGMDGNNLSPYRLTEIVELLKDRQYQSNNDHHIK